MVEFTYPHHIYSALERPDLYEAISKPEHPLQNVYPEYMNHSASEASNWDFLATIPAIARFQFMLAVPSTPEDPGSPLEIIARANSVPFHRKYAAAPTDGPPNVQGDAVAEPLPDGGMDDALRLGVELFRSRHTGDPLDLLDANALSALGIVVVQKWHKMGIAKLLIRTLKQAATQAGFQTVVVPARPTLKHRYLDTDMADYVRWTCDSSRELASGSAGPLPFDPWLRTHVALGGRIMKIAPHSMTIEGTKKDWTEWLGMDVFSAEEKTECEQDAHGEGTTLHEIPGGLVKLRYQPSTGMARYIEPNVWMEYCLS